MDRLRVSRRQFAVTIAGAALATKVGNAVAQQEPLPPEAFGDLHSKMVDGVLGIVGRGERTLESIPGLQKLLAYLVEYKILTKEEADQITAAIAQLEEVLNNKTTLKVVLNRIIAIRNRMAKTAGLVAKGIINIIAASVTYVTNVGSKLSDGDKANIVLKDLSGCLAGAASALLAGQPQLVPLAILFAGAGLSASALGDALAKK
jgi:hypothetical protein